MFPTSILGKGSRKMFLRKALKKFLLLILLLPSASPNHVADWTILIYAQANNSLSKFAHRNFADAAAVGSGKKLNLLVQWFQPGKNGVWRYKIEKGRMNLDVCLPTQTDGNKSEDLVDSVRWAATKYPSKNFSLILWNHGLGIIDPLWGSPIMFIPPHIIAQNPKIQIAGITTPDLSPDIASADLEKDVDRMIETYLHRGILFNERSRTYMNNQTLSHALSTIKNDVLYKKIDVLGMDACLMAMIEVGYQIKDFAHYMVASQEVELAYGWDYKSFLSALIHSSTTPLSFAQTIVRSYEKFYQDKVQFYTQSAIDLSQMALLKESITTVADHVRACKILDHKGFTDVIKRARNQSIQFSTSTYIDLYSFLQQLQKQIQFFYEKNHLAHKGTKLHDLLNGLKKSLVTSMDLVNKSVIANTAGKYLSQACGLSIYFPQNSLDRSYEKTDFAKDCSWHSLLQEATLQ